MQIDAALLERSDDVERVEGGAKEAIELGGDENVAALKLGEERAADRALFDRDRARDASLDRDLAKAQAMHVGVPLQLALLNLEAFAFVDLAHGRHPTVANHRHRPPLSTRQLAVAHVLSAATS